MVKITITIDGVEHSVSREEALRIHMDLSRDLGLLAVDLPGADIPMPPAGPDHPPGALWLWDPDSAPRYTASPAHAADDADPRILASTGFQQAAVTPGALLTLVDSCLQLPTPTGPVLCTSEQTQLLRRGLSDLRDDPGLDQSLLGDDMAFTYTSATGVIVIDVGASHASFSRDVGLALLRVITGEIQSLAVNLGH